MTFPIMPLVTGLTMSANLSAPQGSGTTVTWTATASGGQPPYQYQLAVFDGATWTTVSNWSASNTFVWTPASANAAYQVAARARGSWNTGAREMATTQAFAIKPIVTAIVEWTGQRKYTVDMLTRRLTARCEQLRLEAPADEPRALLEIGSYLSALVTNHLHTGRFKRSV